MAEERFDPIVLKYDGLDANRNFVDLGELGASIQGASRIIASGGHIALTGKFTKTDSLTGVRVLTGPPRPGSYEMLVYLAMLAPPATPFLPIIGTAAKIAATKIVEATVNVVIAKWAGRPKEMEAAKDIAVTALQEMGRTSREAIAAMERVAMSHHTAARQLVAPIGKSATVLQFGRTENGAFQVNEDDRIQIDQRTAPEVEPERSWNVLITELDLVNKTCKVSLVDDQDANRRIAGQITDPQIAIPNNPYSSAFDAQISLRVRAKAQVKAGDIDKLFISDVDGRPPNERAA